MYPRRCIIVLVFLILSLPFFGRVVLCCIELSSALLHMPWVYSRFAAFCHSFSRFVSIGIPLPSTCSLLLLSPVLGACFLCLARLLCLFCTLSFLPLFAPCYVFCSSCCPPSSILFPSCLLSFLSILSSVTAFLAGRPLPPLFVLFLYF